MTVINILYTRRKQPFKDLENRKHFVMQTSFTMTYNMVSPDLRENVTLTEINTYHRWHKCLCGECQLVPNGMAPKWWCSRTIPTKCWAIFKVEVRAIETRPHPICGATATPHCSFHLSQKVLADSPLYSLLHSNLLHLYLYTTPPFLVMLSLSFVPPKQFLMVMHPLSGPRCVYYHKCSWSFHLVP